MAGHLKKHSSGHLALHASGHLKRKATYATTLVATVKYGIRVFESFDGLSYQQQYARMGEIWGEIYPADVRDDAGFTAVNAVVAEWNVGPAPDYDCRFSAVSTGFLYRVTADGALTTGVTISGLRHTLTLAESAGFDNPTTGILFIGTGADSPEDSNPHNWASNVLSTSSEASLATVSPFVCQGYFWVAGRVTNASDAAYGTDINWFSKSRTATTALNFNNVAYS